MIICVKKSVILPGVASYTLVDYSHHPTRCAVMFVCGFSLWRVGTYLHVCSRLAPQQQSPLVSGAPSSFHSLFVARQLFANCGGSIFFLSFFCAHQWCGTHWDGHSLEKCLRHNLSQSLSRWRHQHHRHWEQPTHTHLLWPAAGKLLCECFMSPLICKDDVSVFACFSMFLAGIPCPIIVAWAIGKLYYENEQWVPSGSVLFLKVLQLFVLICW